MTAELAGARLEVVELVDDLARTLAEAGVRYCHWKSNEAIDRSLSAENDLDLLVAPGDLSRFLVSTAALGFRLALPPSDRRVPGHLALYGLDEPTGKLVQIDAQTRLVLGDDMTKNYRLPIEQAYLDDLDTSGVLPLPRPEFEYLVFVVRMVLKHCPWDAQLSYKARLTASERRELAYLEARIDRGAVDEIRRRHLPMISSELLQVCRRALGRELGPLARARVAHHLTAALQGLERHDPRLDTGLKLMRRVKNWVQKRLSPASRKKTLAGGGMVVAIVGGDGSGKSSAVDGLEAFLRRHFRTRRFHMGKPRPSRLTRLVDPVLRRLPGDHGLKGLPPWEIERLDRFPGYAYFIHHLLIARDRFLTSVAARRAATRGALVVCDRFPLPGLETMDCPRLQRLPEGSGRALARWMGEWEARYYDRLGQPDAVFVLKVDPEIAVARRVEQDGEFVRRRAAEIFQREWKEPNVFIVDASKPLDQVQDQVRALTWSFL